MMNIFRGTQKKRRLLKWTYNQKEGVGIVFEELLGMRVISQEQKSKITGVVKSGRYERSKELVWFRKNCKMPIGW